MGVILEVLEASGGAGGGAVEGLGAGFVVHGGSCNSPFHGNARAQRRKGAKKERMFFAFLQLDPATAV